MLMVLFLLPMTWAAHVGAAIVCDQGPLEHSSGRDCVSQSTASLTSQEAVIQHSPPVIHKSSDILPDNKKSTRRINYPEVFISVHATKTEYPTDKASNIVTHNSDVSTVVTQLFSFVNTTPVSSGVVSEIFSTVTEKSRALSVDPSITSKSQEVSDETSKTVTHNFKVTPHSSSTIITHHPTMMLITGYTTNQHSSFNSMTSSAKNEGYNKVFGTSPAKIGQVTFTPTPAKESSPRTATRTTSKTTTAKPQPFSTPTETVKIYQQLPGASTMVTRQPHHKFTSSQQYAKTKIYREATGTAIAFQQSPIILGHTTVSREPRSFTMTQKFTATPEKSETQIVREPIGPTIQQIDVTHYSGMLTRTSGEMDVTTEPPTLNISGNLSSERAVLLERFKELYPLQLWRVHGFFNDDFLRLVDTVWLRHPPPSPAAHYTLAALYCIIMAVGVVGNGLVIYLFIRSRSLRTPANILVLNLAVSDLFLLLNMLLFVYNSAWRGPALGDIGCQVYGFLGGLTGTVSIVTLALIAYDRYNVIVFPMEPMRKTSKTRARAMVFCSWGYGAIFSSLPLVQVGGINPYSPEGYLTSCSFDYLAQDSSNRVYILSFFAAAWVLPLTLIIFCYTRICQMVLRTSEITKASESQRHCREEEKRKSEQKLAVIVAGVVGLWFVSWTPYAVVALLGVTGQHHLITPLSSMVPALFCKTASCMDPFVYAVTHPRFRKELVSLLRSVVGKKRRGRSLQSQVSSKKRCWTVEGDGDTDLGRRRSEACSESSDVEVEEVLVMVERGRTVSSDSGSSGSSTERHPRNRRRRRSQRISWTVDQPFPFSDAVRKQLQPPSWFVPPKNRSNLSTSLRLKERVAPSAEPTSM